MRSYPGIKIFVEMSRKCLTTAELVTLNWLVKFQCILVW